MIDRSFSERALERTNRTDACILRGEFLTFLTVMDLKYCHGQKTYTPAQYEEIQAN